MRRVYEITNLLQENLLFEKGADAHCLLMKSLQDNFKYHLIETDFGNLWLLPNGTTSKFAIRYGGIKGHVIFGADNTNIYLSVIDQTLFEKELSLENLEFYTEMHSWLLNKFVKINENSVTKIHTFNKDCLWNFYNYKVVA